MTSPFSHTVLVIGAGLAGLTTAYYLYQQGYHITLLDHPDWLDGFRTDASQPAPIILGCHHETRQILRALDLLANQSIRGNRHYAIFCF